MKNDYSNFILECVSRKYLILIVVFFISLYHAEIKASSSKYIVHIPVPEMEVRVSFDEVKLALAIEVFNKGRSEICLNNGFAHHSSTNISIVNFKTGVELEEIYGLTSGSVGFHRISSGQKTFEIEFLKPRFPELLEFNNITYELRFSTRLEFYSDYFEQCNNFDDVIVEGNIKIDLDSK